MHYAHVSSFTSVSHNLANKKYFVSFHSHNDSERVKNKLITEQNLRAAALMRHCVYACCHSHCCLLSFRLLSLIKVSYSHKSIIKYHTHAIIHIVVSHKSIILLFRLVCILLISNFCNEISPCLLIGQDSGHSLM